MTCSDNPFDTARRLRLEPHEANARLASTMPRLLEALIVCANLLADYDEQKGEEGDAYREAIAAIEEATSISVTLENVQSEAI